jgi:hypothetical protein
MLGVEGESESGSLVGTKIAMITIDRESLFLGVDGSDDNNNSKTYLP